MVLWRWRRRRVDGAISSRVYYVLLVALWVYSVVWVWANVRTFTSQLPLWSKTLLGVVLVVGTPSVSDLFASYEDYLETHRRLFPTVFSTQVQCGRSVREGVGRQRE